MSKKEHRYQGVLYSEHGVLTKTALYSNKTDAVAAVKRLLEEYQPSFYVIENLPNTQEAGHEPFPMRKMRRKHP